MIAGEELFILPGGIRFAIIFHPSQERCASLIRRSWTEFYEVLLRGDTRSPELIEIGRALSKTRLVTFHWRFGARMAVQFLSGSCGTRTFAKTFEAAGQPDFLYSPRAWSWITPQKDVVPATCKK